MLGTNCEISEKYTPVRCERAARSHMRSVQLRSPRRLARDSDAELQTTRGARNPATRLCQFAVQALKTKLMHMDRLIKLVPTVLELPSSVDTKARAELVRETVMQPVLKPYKVQARTQARGSKASLSSTSFGGKAALSRANMTAMSKAGGSFGGTTPSSSVAMPQAEGMPGGSRGFKGSRPSVAILSLSAKKATVIESDEESDDSDKPAGKPPPRPGQAPTTPKGAGSDGNARAGRTAGDSEARQGKSILGAVKLNLRHNIGIDGAGDPLGAEPRPIPPSSAPSGSPGMRTLGNMPGGGLMPAGMGRPMSTPAGGLMPAGMGRPMPTPPGASPAKPAAPPTASPAKPAASPAKPAAPPPKSALRQAPGKKPEPPPPPVKEDKNAHLKKTAADVDMSALLNGSDDSDDSMMNSDGDDDDDDDSDAS
jgi:hypothetical protein